MDDSRTLSGDHETELIVDSAISREVVAARGYRTLTGTAEDRQYLEDAGYSRAVWDRDDAYPMLLVPMHGADGHENGIQVKPAVPRVRMNSQGEPKPLKYETPRGAPLVVDMPPLSLQWLRDDEGRAAWFTEGMKKTDALVTAGCAAFGLTGVFNWRNKLGSLGDWEDVPIKGRPAVVCFDADAEGNRFVQLAMGRFGSWLKSRGASAVHYVVVPSEVDGTPVKGVDDFLAAGGTVQGLFDVARQTPPGTNGADASFTDAYLVEEVCSGALDGRFCWASGLGWMKWDGRVWTTVSDTEPVEAVRQWALSQYESVVAEQRRDASRNLTGQMKGWQGTLAKTRLRALVDLARGIVERYAEDFDSDPDLLTVQNGTLHLPTGSLRPFDPANSMTLVAGAEYRPGYRHPLWEKALEAVPAELRPWLQDRLGQALTGYKTPDHVLVLSYGSGSNGKSTVTNTVRRALGKYGVLISDRVLMANPGDHPTELMDLRGARYAVLEETPEARHLNVQRLKAVGGGTEEITARYIRENSVTFKATHSMFVNSNYKPTVNETDHGTWRRLALLTYPFTFRKRPSEVVSHTDRLGDPAMEYAHDDPNVRAACLAWMVDGSRAWYARGRRMMEIPQLVEDDTRQWRTETDLIMGFADDVLKLHPESFVTATSLLEAFNGWSAERGHRPWNDKTFASRFGGHDTIRAAKVTTGRKYVGGRQVRGWHGVEVRRGDDPFDNTPPPKEEPPAPAPELALPEERDTPSAPRSEAASEAPCGGPLGFDLETASASQLFMGGHDGPFVRLAGGAHPYGQVQVTDVPGYLLDELETAPGIYGHNILGFDLLALAYHHGADYDALAAKAVDTQVLSQLLDPPGARGGDRTSHTLDDLAKRLGHAGKTNDVKVLAAKHGGFDKIPLDDPEYNDYLRGDLAATRFVYEKLTDLPDYAQREMRVAALQNRMTLNGWAIDTGLLAERVAEEAAKVAEAKERLAEYGVPMAKPDRFKLKLKKDWPQDWSMADVRALDGETQEREGFAVRIPGEVYASPWATDAGREALVKAFADAGASYVPRTASGVLKLSADALGEGMWWDKDRGESFPGMLHPKAYGHLPAVRELCGILALATGATAKYDEIQRWTNAKGRVHAKVGAPQASGRWATSEPASSNLHPSHRAVFVADPGHVLITCDLSQVDVRALAGHSQDPALIAMLQPGMDYHAEMAEIMCGDRTRRKEYKPVSHGLNYNQSPRSVAEQHGLDVAATFAAKAKHAERLHVFEEWKIGVVELARTGSLLDNGFGRMMRCDPDRAWTQAPALMGQGGARDIMTESMLRFVKLADDLTVNARPYLRGVVHDELVVSVPEDQAVMWQVLLREAFTWEWRGVPILAEVSNPAYRWSDCEH